MPYHHFTTEECYVISHMAIAGFSLREIGRHIGRHHTSISREIAQNRPTYADDAAYRYDAAEFFAKPRHHKARHHRRRHDSLLSAISSIISGDTISTGEGKSAMGPAGDSFQGESRSMSCRQLLENSSASVTGRVYGKRQGNRSTHDQCGA